MGVEQMYKLKIDIDPLMYALVMNALRVDHKWKISMNLLEDMMAHNVEPGIINYNMVMDTCWKGGAWAVTLELMKELKTKDIEPNLESYNICLSACGRGEKYSEAMALIEEMGGGKIEPNLCSYKVVELLFSDIERDNLHDALDLAHELANTDDSVSDDLHEEEDDDEEDDDDDEQSSETASASIIVTDKKMNDIYSHDDLTNTMKAFNSGKIVVESNLEDVDADENGAEADDEEDDYFLYDDEENIDFDALEEEFAEYGNGYVTPSTESSQIGLSITARGSTANWNKREFIDNFYNSSGIFAFPVTSDISDTEAENQESLGTSNSSSPENTTDTTKDKGDDLKAENTNTDPDTKSTSPKRGESGDEKL